MAKKGFNAEWLKGLTFSFGEKREITKDGRKIEQYFPATRALAEEDILDWKDKGEFVTLVTKDGKKYNVKK